MPDPATLPQGTAPGTTPPANQPAPAPAPQAPPANKVEISSEEYARLQRNEARLKAFQRRSTIPAPRASAPAARHSPASANDDDPNEELLRARAETAAYQRELLDERIKTGTRELLDKPEYKDLPESTKRLILRNPASLTQSEDIDSALGDIEDFLLSEIASSPGAKPAAPAAAAPAAEPAGHETPRAHAGAAASVPGPGDLEDLSQLHGADRSRAAIRNAIKTKKMAA